MQHLNINPPLLNSANPWATTYEDILALYKCASTGAVTTRTCTIHGFKHDDKINQFTFFDSETYETTGPNPTYTQDTGTNTNVRLNGSLNTLGYSPLPLAETLVNITRVWLDVSRDDALRKDKPFLVSVTGTPAEVQEAYRMIEDLSEEVGFQLYLELNLSCPNIVGKPPPAYSYENLLEYLLAFNAVMENSNSKVLVGIKTPPYTNPYDFSTVQRALLDAAEASSSRRPPVSFITAVNTLGSSLLLTEMPGPQRGYGPQLNSLDGSGIGGLAGAPLHPLALGNVFRLRRMLDEKDQLKDIVVIGIGGVEDAAGYQRMRAAGAAAVGVGTALGRKGINIFQHITLGFEEIFGIPFN